jgi:hypothetical protein
MFLPSISKTRYSVDKISLLCNQTGSGSETKHGEMMDWLLAMENPKKLREKPTLLALRVSWISHGIEPGPQQWEAST